VSKTGLAGSRAAGYECEQHTAEPENGHS
jgi:hypothetical protein